MLLLSLSAALPAPARRARAQAAPPPASAALPTSAEAFAARVDSLFADAFVSGQYTIQFVRRRGRVTGFEISHPRARGVAFTRTGATQ